MGTGNRIMVAIAAIIITIVLTVLVILHFLNVEPLLGLLGVIIGALIAEFSHHQSARDERRHQLRLAALDRRLEAHQQAFSLWKCLMRDLGDPVKIRQTALDCQEWWNNNCLYLTADARQAFSHAYMTAASHETTIRNADAKLVQYETEVIRQAGNKIVQGVELPTISEGEEKDIKPDHHSDA